MIRDKEFPLSSKNTKDILKVNHISETIDTLISVIDNVTIEGIFISDNQRKCIQANNIAANIFGYTKDEMIGLEISQLVAPESQELIKNKILNQDNEHYEAFLLRKNGEKFPAMIRGKTIKSNNETIRVSAILDTTFIKEKDKEIRNLAYHDALTSLANRTLLLDRLENLIDLSERSKNFASLMFIDLDHFKKINDNEGHLFGDLLLKETAKRLTKIVRKGDTVSRFGGDEFVILLDTQITDPIEALKTVEVIASKILFELSSSFKIRNKEFNISASIGIMMFSGTKYSIDQLLKYADKAMYQSKQKGRNTYTFFDDELLRMKKKKQELINKLNHAIENSIIDFYYQKQIDKDNKVIGIELFAHWIDEELGLIDTGKFILLASEIGIIKKLDELVLDKAVSLIKKWENDLEKKEWLVSINVSLKQFERDDFISLIKDTFDRYDTSLGKLRIEITENLFSKSENKIFKKVDELKNLGIKLSIDDFATDYISLPYLKKLSIDEIKIDKLFIENILHDEDNQAVILAILEIAKKFNFKIIVEGVETKEVFEKLQKMGFDNFQGYYISRPKSLDEI